MKQLLRFGILCLLLAAAIPLPRANAAGLVDSIGMPAPEGFREVEPAGSPEYIAALSLETALRFDVFLRLFVREDEYAKVQSLDVDELSGTVLAVWFQEVHDVRRSNFMSPSALQHLTGRGEQTSNAGPAAPASVTESFSEAMTRKVNTKRIEAMQAAFEKHRTNPDATGAAAVDAARVRQWLESGGKAPQADLDLGFVRSGHGYALYTWLQSADSDLFSYGMPAVRPVSVVYAMIAMGDRTLGLIFTDRIHTSDDVAASLDRAVAYTEKNRDAISITPAAPNPKITKSANVLSYAAAEWFNQQKAAKAVKGYKMLVALAEELKVPWMKVAAAADLGEAYILHAEPEAAVEEMPAFLAEAQQIPGAGDTVIKLYEVLGTAYAISRQTAKAEEHFSKGLELSLAAHGNLNRTTILFQSQLFRVIAGETPAREETPSRSARLAEEALLWNTELGEEWIQPMLLTNLMIVSAVQEKVLSAVFYSKLAMAHTFFAGNEFQDPMYDTLLRLFKIGLSTGGREPDDEELNAILTAPNAPGDTPYTRARDWMHGSEAALYAKYGETAGALEKAGASGTEEEKKRARAAFRDWLRSVDAVLEAEPR